MQSVIPLNRWDGAWDGVGARPGQRAGHGIQKAGVAKLKDRNKPIPRPEVNQSDR